MARKGKGMYLESSTFFQCVQVLIPLGCWLNQCENFGNRLSFDFLPSQLLFYMLHGATFFTFITTYCGFTRGGKSTCYCYSTSFMVTMYHSGFDGSNWRRRFLFGYLHWDHYQHYTLVVDWHGGGYHVGEIWAITLGMLIHFKKATEMWLESTYITYFMVVVAWTCSSCGC